MPRPSLFARNKAAKGAYDALIAEVHSQTPGSGNERQSIKSQLESSAEQEEEAGGDTKESKMPALGGEVLKTPSRKKSARGNSKARPVKKGENLVVDQNTPTPPKSPLRETGRQSTWAQGLIDQKPRRESTAISPNGGREESLASPGPPDVRYGLSSPTGDDSRTLGRSEERDRRDARLQSIIAGTSRMSSHHQTSAAASPHVVMRAPEDPFDLTNHPLRPQQPYEPHISRPMLPQHTAGFPFSPARPTPAVSAQQPRVFPPPYPQPGPFPPSTTTTTTTTQNLISPLPSPREIAHAYLLRLNASMGAKLENRITSAIHARLLIEPDTFGAELLQILRLVCHSAEKADHLINTFPWAEGDKLRALSGRDVRLESQLCVGQASGLINMVYDLSQGDAVWARAREEIVGIYRRMCEHDAQSRSQEDLVELQAYLAQVGGTVE